MLLALIKKRPYLSVMIGLSLLYFLFKKEVNSTLMSAFSSPYDSLHPNLKPKALALISEAKKQGIELRITSGLRSWDDQTKLYNQGRLTEGKIVTNAKAGDSMHNYGLAFDVVPVEGYSSKNWGKIGEIGKKLGLTWGGDWKFKDMPHFELKTGKTLAQLKEMYLKNGNKNYINLV